MGTHTCYKAVASALRKNVELHHISSPIPHLSRKVRADIGLWSGLQGCSRWHLECWETGLMSSSHPASRIALRISVNCHVNFCHHSLRIRLQLQVVRPNVHPCRCLRKKPVLMGSAGVHVHRVEAESARYDLCALLHACTLPCYARAARPVSELWASQLGQRGCGMCTCVSLCARYCG